MELVDIRGIPVAKEDAFKSNLRQSRKDWEQVYHRKRRRVRR